MVNETGDEGVSPVSRLAARAERSRDQRGAVRTGAAAAAGPMRSRARLRSTSRWPMPLTRARSSMLRNAPLRVRWSTIAWALAGPIPTSSRARVGVRGVDVDEGLGRGGHGCGGRCGDGDFGERHEQQTEDGQQHDEPRANVRSRMLRDQPRFAPGQSPARKVPSPHRNATVT